jgi:tetratricopeptide (TPR) repeat protein
MCFEITGIDNNLFAQKSNYKQVIDSLVKVSKDIQYKNPDSAIILFSSLANYYKLDNNLDEYHITQSNIANCYLIQRNNNDALKIYIECSKYFKQKNDSVHLYTVYSGIAGIYYNLNDPQKIAAYLQMATQICNVKKFPNLKFIAIVNLGNCFSMSKQYDSAFSCYNQAKEILSLIKEPIYAYQLKIQFASLYYVTHKYNLAIENALYALKSNNNFDTRLTMTAYNLLGLCYLDTKDFKKSRLYLDSSIVLSKKINSQADTYEFLLQKSKLNEVEGEYKSATEDLHQVLNIKDSLFEMNKTNLTKELLIKYETEKKDYQNKLLENENAKRNIIIKWQRVLIFLVAILSLTIFIILFFYLRYRNRQQKKIIEKDKIDSELKALKAQLNPHFIQNIFQIITNQVDTNPSEVAGFLQKTSNYFRSVLNGTDKSVQSLEDEIIFTEEYLQFQQSIFENKLTYEINLADDVDSFGIMVPAMLLQPFIENSVKYGLQLTQKPMHIKIDFEKDENFLNITIIDNGNFMINETIANDKSFGNVLITKRLFLFYKNAAQKPSLTAKPVENNNGFIVEIKLPLQ